MSSKDWAFPSNISDLNDYLRIEADAWNEDSVLTVEALAACYGAPQDDSHTLDNGPERTLSTEDDADEQHTHDSLIPQQEVDNCLEDCTKDIPPRHLCLSTIHVIANIEPPTPKTDARPIPATEKFSREFLSMSAHHVIASLDPVEPSAPFQSRPPLTSRRLSLAMSIAHSTLSIEPVEPIRHSRSRSPMNRGTPVPFSASKILVIADVEPPRPIQNLAIKFRGDRDIVARSAEDKASGDAAYIPEATCPEEATASFTGSVDTADSMLEVTMVPKVDNNHGDDLEDTDCLAEIPASQPHPQQLSVSEQQYDQLSPAEIPKTSAQASMLSIDKIDSEMARQQETSNTDVDGLEPALPHPKLEPCSEDFSGTSTSHQVAPGASIDEPIFIDDDNMLAVGQEGDSSSELGRATSSTSSPAPTSSRVRSKPQRADGVVLWTEPDFEAKSMSKTTNEWYQIQSRWMCVRQLPLLKNKLCVQQYDRLINNIANKAVANEVLACEDVIALRDHYSSLARRHSSKLPKHDRDLVRRLKKRLGRFYEDYQMAKLIADHPMQDDENDVDYRPVKRSRR